MNDDSSVITHKLTLIIGKRRQLVNVFTRVDTVRDAEAKVEIEAFDKAILEEMTLNHAKPFDGQVSHTKLDPKTSSSIVACIITVTLYYYYYYYY